jgi:hypothetical protein
MSASRPGATPSSCTRTRSRTAPSTICAPS